MHRVHRVVARSLAELNARDLLTAPLSPIPIVGPLANALDGNGANGVSTPSPNSQPAPVSTASEGDGGNSGSNSNGGGNGNGRGNASGGSTSGGSTSGGNSNVGGNSNGGGTSNGSGGGNGGSGGSTPAPTKATTGGGGSVAPLTFGSFPTSTPSATGKTSNGALNTNGVSSNVGSASSGFTETDLQTVSGATSGALADSLRVAPPTGSSSPSSPDTTSNTVDARLSFPTTSTAAATTSSKRLSDGAIAGVVIVCLFGVLALLLLVIRRCSIAHRLKLRRQWRFNHTLSGRHSFLGTAVGSNTESSAGAASVRSSFATNFDQGLMFRSAPPATFPTAIVPDMPPAAEIRERNSTLISTGATVARNESINTILGDGSDPDARYLTCPTGQRDVGSHAPMLVRPFSPSEFFAFPKPPGSSSAIDSSLGSCVLAPTSSRSSGSTLVQLSPPPLAFTSDQASASVKSPSLYPQTSYATLTRSPQIVGVDPFANPAKSEFAEVEVIRRPFAPALEDELAVHQGDRVYVRRVFDDGWALVEKVADPPDTERTQSERGLIPVDCLRGGGQPLPTFLAEKRLSYGLAVAL